MRERFGTPVALEISVSVQRSFFVTTATALIAFVLWHLAAPLPPAAPPADQPRPVPAAEPRPAERTPAPLPSLPKPPSREARPRFA